MNPVESSLLPYFQKYHGLLSINSKNTPETNLPSSLFVTSKIGHSCVELLKNPQKIYDITNKANSMLIITDSSGFPNHLYPHENYNILNDMAIPHLESLAIYYKQVSNIDSYPIVLDHSMIKSGKDLMRVILNITSAYSAVELYKIDDLKLSEAIELYQEKPRNFAIYTTKEKNYLEELMKKNNITLNSLFVSTCILRAALDTQSYVLIPNELLEKIVIFLTQQNLSAFYVNFYEVADELIVFCAQYFIDHKLNDNKMITVEEVENKYQTFLLEGSNSNNVSNGLIEIHPNYNFQDPFVLDSLFNEENFNEISNYIEFHPEEVENITCKNKFIANVSNAFLLDKSGKQSSVYNLPFMEGQASFSHHLGLPELIPICVEEENMEETVKCIAPIFKKVALFKNQI